MTAPIYLRQLEIGPMQNYVYLVGDPETREAGFVHRISDLSDSDVVAVEGGDVVHVGNVPITFIHTPGHTPGSQCFLAAGNLISGDTLFIGSCGRSDLPGSDPAELYRSLNHTLRNLPDKTIVYPGHNYADRPTSTIGHEKRRIMFMRFQSVDEFLRSMGR